MPDLEEEIKKIVKETILECKNENLEDSVRDLEEKMFALMRYLEVEFVKSEVGKDWQDNKNEFRKIINSIKCLPKKKNT